MKQLSTVRVAGSSPTTLLTNNDRVRIVYQYSQILLVRRPLFRGEEIALRYPVTQLALVKCKPVPTTSMGWGPLVESVQFLRNTESYGFWDGMAATNLQNMNAQQNTVQALTMGFLVPGAEFEMQAFLFTDCWGSSVPLADTSAYLQSQLIKIQRLGHGA